jgi:hypothetical protein
VSARIASRERSLACVAVAAAARPVLLPSKRAGAPQQHLAGGHCAHGSCPFPPLNNQTNQHQHSKAVSKPPARVVVLAHCGAQLHAPPPGSSSPSQLPQPPPPPGPGPGPASARAHDAEGGSTVHPAEAAEAVGGVAPNIPPRPKHPPGIARGGAELDALLAGQQAQVLQVGALCLRWVLAVHACVRARASWTCTTTTCFRRVYNMPPLTRFVVGRCCLRRRCTRGRAATGTLRRPRLLRRLTLAAAAAVAVTWTEAQRCPQQLRGGQAS